MLFAYVGSARKITRTCSSRRLSAESTPRATLVPFPPSRGSVKLQKIVRSVPKFGPSATSSSPPCPRASTRGTPVIGCPFVPVALTMRICPPFSVTSRSPPGSGSTAHGFTSPVVTTATSNATSDVIEHVRVCPADAGRWPDAVGERVSTGVQSAERPTTPAAESRVVVAESAGASERGAQASAASNAIDEATRGREVRMGTWVRETSAWFGKATGRRENVAIGGPVPDGRLTLEHGTLTADRRPQTADLSE